MQIQTLEVPGPAFSPGLSPHQLGALGKSSNLPDHKDSALRDVEGFEDMNVKHTACAWYGEIVP